MKWFLMLMFPLRLMAEELYLAGDDKLIDHKKNVTINFKAYLRVHNGKDSLDLSFHRCKLLEPTCDHFTMRYVKGINAKWIQELPKITDPNTKTTLKVSSDGFKVDSYELDQQFPQGSFHMTYTMVASGARLKSKSIRNGTLMNERSSVLNFVERRKYEASLRGKKIEKR